MGAPKDLSSKYAKKYLYILLLKNGYAMEKHRANASSHRAIH